MVGVARQHVVGEGVAALQGLGAISVGADDRHPAQMLTRADQRKDAVVGQQHHGPLRQPAGRRLVLGWVQVDDRRGVVGERVGLEKTEGLFLGERSEDGPIHVRLGEGARTDLLRQWGQVRVTRRQLDVDPGGQR